MIRLNLLPHRTEQRQRASSNLRRQAYWGLGIFLALVVVVTLALSLALWQQQQRNRYLQTLITTQTAIAQRSQTLSEQVAERQAQGQQLNHALAQQSLPWYMLTQLQSIIPNGLQLTSLAWQPPYLTLEGLASSHEAIALLVTDMNQAPWLTEATLLSSQQQDRAWSFALSTEMSPP
ncbi:MAG: PilN domain-containing protein [Neisseriaceae bacterium]|nr:PilN domain-containing protein [Neisseriaceae bacterium]MBP6862386.1 PilN domain-containing protein [Neisseriaceae bacterium]